LLSLFDWLEIKVNIQAASPFPMLFEYYIRGQENRRILDKNALANLIKLCIYCIFFT
jgi:hypothetical protein